MTIEIRPAQWARDEKLLAEIRRRVFIEEQAVPEHLEWDDKDNDAQHWLALLHGQPIGTARLVRGGHIGRMAVLMRGRGQGIGSALLKAAIEHAQSQQLREVYLHAQLHALPFYQRHGFRAEGPEFMDAGIAHRTMRLVLREQRVLGNDSGRYVARDRGIVAIDLARQCRRQLRLFSNSLDQAVYGSNDFAEALSQLARRSRFTDIRLLVADVRPLIQRGHILLELQRKLSSTIQLRRADCEINDISENYLIADDSGILCYSLKEPEQAWSDYNNRPVAENYCVQFDELWHRSIDDPQLRLLNL